MDKIKLYHSSFYEIKNPDIYHGRKNADFGQGFYLSDDIEFSKRWSKYHDGKINYINHYELDTDNLNIKILNRDKTWFEYIFSNRRYTEDLYDEYDVIIGPIANDTLYDTFGVITSGILQDDVALKLLLIGNEYKQIVIKAEKANKQLKFIKVETLDKEVLDIYHESVRREELEYQKLFTDTLNELV